MKKKFFALATTLLLIAGCSKETTGPQGPQGNANVQTVYYTVQPGQWQSGGNNSWYFNIPVPQITHTIMDSGAVVAYLVGTNNGTTYDEALPHVNSAGASYIDNAQLNVLQIDALNLSVAPTAALQYKIEIIAP